jgi:hypothetical protein
MQPVCPHYCSTSRIQVASETWDNICTHHQKTAKNRGKRRALAARGLSSSSRLTRQWCHRSSFLSKCGEVKLVITDCCQESLGRIELEVPIERRCRHTSPRSERGRRRRRIIVQAPILGVVITTSTPHHHHHHHHPHHHPHQV